MIPVKYTKNTPEVRELLNIWGYRSESINYNGDFVYTKVEKYTDHGKVKYEFYFVTFDKDDKLPFLENNESEFEEFIESTKLQKSNYFKMQKDEWFSKPVKPINKYFR